MSARQSFVAWLIERQGPSGSAEWLVSAIGPAEWTSDANAAVRFDSEEDAHHHIRQSGGPLALGGNRFARPTDHQWIVISPHTAARAARQEAE